MLIEDLHNYPFLIENINASSIFKLNSAANYQKIKAFMEIKCYCSSFIYELHNYILIFQSDLHFNTNVQIDSSYFCQICFNFMPHNLIYINLHIILHLAQYIKSQGQSLNTSLNKYFNLCLGARNTLAPPPPQKSTLTDLFFPECYLSLIPIIFCIKRRHWTGSLLNFKDDTPNSSLRTPL